ncbi:MAG TPA: GNAT family N-acetyltransferase [Anaerolineales bacterium]|nr:GNAT family N-acetyltransferase [Anaerolineales bacterium]HMX18847.1 GNAT family N-acetyltransferase [Anaerolineales bacterium]HMX74914.1 GNAT family N-acetyltransferase [Anaerolineales bacterium]HMZ44047.1 GNAT family N-acetyltransferase [Anaerolineales bacterium]HNA53453.1 GNAT family N-acetyltransferase [Anaerolineales bacterium]
MQTPDSNEPIQLIPASRFNYEELTAIYNQTRVDYMIPMPMNAARLAEYVRIYDVDLDHSLVAATHDGQMLGVAMLGIRKKRVWLTRLGVLPNTRRSGIGSALVGGLIEDAAKLGLDFVMLEVIKNNTPAHQLFLKYGFREIGELLVLRRSPLIPPIDPIVADAQRMDRTEALVLVGHDRGTQPWTNQSESLINAHEVSGLSITLVDGSRGWLVYQREKFLLTRFAIKTEAGDPATVAYALLTHLHSQYPRLDTHIENIQVNDPHLPAYYKMGYVESFRRIEMWRGDFPSSN